MTVLQNLRTFRMISESGSSNFENLAFSISLICIRKYSQQSSSISSFYPPKCSPSGTRFRSKWSLKNQKKKTDPRITNIPDVQQSRCAHHKYSRCTQGSGSLSAILQKMIFLEPHWFHSSLTLDHRLPSKSPGSPLQNHSEWIQNFCVLCWTLISTIVSSIQLNGAWQARCDNEKFWSCQRQ